MWNELAQEIHAIACEHGFWNLPLEYAVPIKLALIHSEITEYARATSTQHKLEEIADIAIRVLDLGRYTKLDPDQHMSIQGFGQILDLHVEVSHALEADRKGDMDQVNQCLNRILGLCQHHAVLYSGRLLPEVSKKVQVNKARPFRHGGKRY